MVGKVIGMLAVVAGLAACGPKAPVEPAAPREGWIQDEGWAAACWYPPNFDAIGGGARRIARSEAITALMSQWRGERNDGIHLDEQQVHAVETTLLGFPDRAEWIAQENLEQCVAAMSHGGRTTAWSTWLAGLNVRAREGLCPYRPLDYTLFDYLSIEAPWQISRRVCEGDTVHVSASGTDYYRIEDGGPWINAAGDLTQPAVGTDLPCNLETCYAGQVILKFEGADGYNNVIPVGLGVDFVAPGHGLISVQINDRTWTDNTWKVEGGMQHHTAIEYDGE